MRWIERRKLLDNFRRRLDEVTAKYSRLCLGIDPSESEVYRASAVIDGLGMERAVAFLKVDAKITTYLKKASAMGAVSMEEITKCRKGITKKYRMGYIKIQKKKDLTK
jgi:hypothetical protein